MSMPQFDVMMEHAIDINGPQSTARDAGGGTTLTWPTIRASSQPCLINAPMGITKDQFGQDMFVGTVQVATFYTGTQRGDQLTIVAGPTMVGAKLKVTGIKTQPGVAFLGFEDLSHISAEQVT